MFFGNVFDGSSLFGVPLVEFGVHAGDIVCRRSLTIERNMVFVWGIDIRNVVGGCGEAGRQRFVSLGRWDFCQCFFGVSCLWFTICFRSYGLLVVGYMESLTVQPVSRVLD